MMDFCSLLSDTYASWIRSLKLIVIKAGISAAINNCSTTLDCKREKEESGSDECEKV